MAWHHFDVLGEFPQAESSIATCASRHSKTMPTHRGRRRHRQRHRVAAEVDRRSSVIGGLVGGGSLFAMDRLAHSVASPSSLRRWIELNRLRRPVGVPHAISLLRRPGGLFGPRVRRAHQPGRWTAADLRQLGVSTRAAPTRRGDPRHFPVKDLVHQRKSQLALEPRSRRLGRLISVGDPQGCARHVAPRSPARGRRRSAAQA